MDILCSKTTPLFVAGILLGGGGAFCLPPTLLGFMPLSDSSSHNASVENGSSSPIIVSFHIGVIFNFHDYVRHPSSSPVQSLRVDLESHQPSQLYQKPPPKTPRTWKRSVTPWKKGRPTCLDFQVMWENVARLRNKKLITVNSIYVTKLQVDTLKLVAHCTCAVLKSCWHMLWKGNWPLKNGLNECLLI